jgi:membrane protein DedA with SNARE-associated domain
LESLKWLGDFSDFNDLNMDTSRGLGFINDYRYIGVFCAFFLYATGCASIIPGRSMMIFVGVMCHRGYLNPYVAAPAALIASIIGANLGYVIGRYTVGNILARRDRFIFLSRATLEKGMAAARRHGAKLIVPAMFVGGFWALTSLIPGMVKMKYSRFAAVNALGLIAWVIALMCMGYFGGYVWSRTFMGKSYIVVLVVAGAAALFIIWKTVIRKWRYQAKSVLERSEGNGNKEENA